ncbi:MAG TPA: helix-turn-helix transcriptional regulator [Candidatus Sulfotelmatobacter sp.]|nr:helix-turn-helix transcriptional regulator [Candidatus Sulfotelmatobacter sp.]
MNDLLLLSALLAGPQHGYALKKQVGLLTGQGAMHNNLVYPLLRRFVENRWVSHKQSAGERGQTREVYALTPKGKRELLRRLTEYGMEDARSENGFRLRVGLFAFLEHATREHILAMRDKFLAAREERLERIVSAVGAGSWGSEVVQFFREQLRAEREWIAGLTRKAKRETSLIKHA